MAEKRSISIRDNVWQLWHWLCQCLARAERASLGCYWIRGVNSQHPRLAPTAQILIAISRITEANGDPLIDANLANRLASRVRPEEIEIYRTFGGAEPKMQNQLVLISFAGTSFHVTRQNLIIQLDSHLSPDG
jgi:hypothetical protein